MHPSIVGFIIGCLSFVTSKPEGNITHPIFMTYGRLRQDILDRPVVFHKIPPCLETGFQDRYPLVFSMMIVDVQVIDEIKQVMTLQVFFNIQWRYKELSWNPANYDNISNVWIDSSSIWTPQFLVCMGLENTFILDIDGVLAINSEGWIEFQTLQYVNFACDINFDRYPFDNQICKVGFYPLPLPYADTNIRLVNFSLAKIYNQSGEWVLEKVEYDFLHFVENNVTIQAPVYTLTVKRKSMYYVITIIFPMVLASVMIPLAFLIPVQTGEKVSYLVAIFTSTAVFLNFISDVMPRSLSQMPFLAILLIEVLVEGLLAMLATLLVLNTYRREWTAAERGPRISSGKRDFTIHNEKTTAKPHSIFTEKSPRPDEWIFSSRLLDKMFFFLFTFGQLAFLLVLLAGSNWIMHWR